ncbi:DUF3800 domain-containing protein [Candidatus Uhrbacteria bacterium]|nr:DUF3800 domain-containing protein [Candidatus Uhrbacteria bacterium]
MQKQKLYCYVDESGQDARSTFFVVVAVITEENERLKEKLQRIEKSAGVGNKKWRKTRSSNRCRYLQTLLEQQIGFGSVFFGAYKKPLPYFFPILEIIEKSIQAKAAQTYRAIVVVDGIDNKKAAELTGALRLKGIVLDFVRSGRDESEALLRLADRWVGCVRKAREEKNSEEDLIMQNAIAQGYLQSLSK